MSASYEIWLTDDVGRRLTLLENISFFSYTRSTGGPGTIQLGLPFTFYQSIMPSLFQPDWRLDIWRSPAEGYPKRRESSFFLRKPHIYQRITDGLLMIEFYGRNPWDILRRFSFPPWGVAPYVGPIDDAMKHYASSTFITPPATGMAPQPGEWTVEASVSLGDTTHYDPTGKNILDICKALKAESSTNTPKIYFDVLENDGLSGGFGFIFRTFKTLRGMDRTKGLVFSMENGNLSSPDWVDDHLDECTRAIAYNTSKALSVAKDNATAEYLSRWNYIPIWQQVENKTTAGLGSKAAKLLSDNSAKQTLQCSVLNTPGSPTQPRCLYGVDWDLGDLIPVQFAGKNFNAEIQIIYVAVDENGIETITGQNTIGQET